MRNKILGPPVNKEGIRRHLLGLLLSAAVLHSLGCSRMTQGRLGEQQPQTFSIDDVPADRSSPRSLASLTQDEPTPDNKIVARDPSAPPDDPGAIHGGISVSEVKLKNSDVTHIDPGSGIDQIELGNQKQLPDLMEETKRPESQTPTSLKNPSAEVDPLESAASESASQTDLEKNDPDATSKSAKQDAASPELTTPTISAQPPEQPTKILPKSLNALFDTARPFEPNQVDGEVRQVAFQEPANREPPKDDITKDKVQTSQESNRDNELKASKLPEGATKPPTQEAPSTDPVSPRNAAGSRASIDHSQPKPITWNHHLDQTIAALEASLATTLTAEEQRKARVHLEMLKLIAGRFEGDRSWNHRVGQPEPYWSPLFAGIDQLLRQPTGEGQASTAVSQANSAAKAAQLWQQASATLSELAPLKIRNYAFCTEITGFGQYAPAPAKFAAGQQVLLYCELENYLLNETSRDGESFYHAELQADYSIVDSGNRVVYQHRYDVVKDEAKSRRRDFYMYFPIALPQLLKPGTYRLQLSIQDLIGRKMATTEPVVFHIRAPNGPKTAARPTSRSR